jgi:hypothetical protein
MLPLLPSILLAPAIYMVAGVIVSVHRYGNTDAAWWRRIRVMAAWPLFVGEFCL